MTSSERQYLNYKDQYRSNIKLAHEKQKKHDQVIKAERQEQLWQKYQNEESLAVMMRRLRNKLQISQEELAYDVNMAQSAISRIETGSGNPSYKTLMRIARAYKMKIDFVMLD